MTDFVLLASQANPPLGQAIARDLGVSLGALAMERFPDGETAVWLDEPVRGREIFVLHPTQPPVNEHIMELLGIIDACRRAAAARITVVLPYFGYARADKRSPRQEPIMARLVADLLETAGAHHVLLLDPHTFQLEGFFHVSVDALSAVPTLAAAMAGQLPADTVVVAPDAGRVKMAAEYGRLLACPVAVLHKQRISGRETEVTHLVGDVAGRACLLIDDMISTGGTLATGMEALIAQGARPEMYLAATHGLFLGTAVERLSAPHVRQIYTTDSLCLPHPKPAGWREISIAPVLAGAIRTLLAGGALSRS